ncbi:MAG: hypothetical protein ACE5R5_08570, partial [Nitrosarchaeum sp.]
IELILFLILLSVDLDLLEYLMKINEKQPLVYVLHLGGLTYSLSDVSIVNSPTPVNSPTTRGGVYFSDTFAYKIKGTVNDLSVVPLLSKTMLGPNTEFGEIKITTDIVDNNKKTPLSIFTNLTNSVQSSSKIELNMIIVKLESS